MDYSKVVGFTYIFVILALICHSVGAVPKQHEAADKWESKIVSLLVC